MEDKEGYEWISKSRQTGEIHGAEEDKRISRKGVKVLRGSWRVYWLRQRPWKSW